MCAAHTHHSFFHVFIVAFSFSTHTHTTMIIIIIMAHTRFSCATPNWDGICNINFLVGPYDGDPYVLRMELRYGERKQESHNGGKKEMERERGTQKSCIKMLLKFKAPTHCNSHCCDVNRRERKRERISLNRCH